MNLNRIKQLRDEWRDHATLRRGAEKAFDYIGFTQAYVTERVSAVRAGKVVQKTKYIKDHVWGMIEADWRTVRLLDSPVVQRLRGIKQLGLSYLTYPSAEHSRFIHSLGMYSVVAKFLSAIDTRAEEPAPASGERYVSSAGLAPITALDLMHAGLLHDIGHMPFSHATEAALEAHGERFFCGGLSVQEIQSQVARKLSKSLSLSETLSLVVILSERFDRFYQDFVLATADADATARIGALVAGLPPTPKLSGVAQIISSDTVDADKIDYVNRDAKACGIPIGVDVARIFLRSALVELPRDRLVHLKDEPEAEEILFVINASGVDTLEEITQSRAALYQRVYLHPVTRAAEVLLAQSLYSNISSQKPNRELTDALELWKLSDDLLLHRLTAGRGESKRFATCIMRRNLPKKACAFSGSIAEMQIPLRSIFGRLGPSHAETLRKLVVNTPLEALTSKKLSGQDARRIEAAIDASVNELVDMLREVYPGRIPTKAYHGCHLIPSAYMDARPQDCIVLQNGEPLRSKTFTNVRETNDAIDIYKAVGFVMADSEWTPFVLLAARKVLASIRYDPTPAEFNVGPIEVSAQVLGRTLLSLAGVLRRSGVKGEKFDEVLSAALEVGYFDDMPVLAPLEGGGGQAVAEVATKLQSFSGEAGWSVRRDTVAAFLNQFPPRLRPAMADVLRRHFVILEGPEIQSLVGDQLIGMKPGIVAPFSPTSGNAVRGDVERQAKRLPGAYSEIKIAKSIQEALADDATGTIALVDDNVSSGVQARAQLLAWAGRPRAEWPEECRREDGIYREPLRKEEWEELCARPMRLVVAAGRSEGAARVEEVAKLLGVSDFAVSFNRPIEGLKEWPEDLRKFLTNVGLELMSWNKFATGSDSLDEQKLNECSARAFGYGNVGALLATHTNVPTSTVTAIWMPGMYKGNPWFPLLIRQNRVSDLIIA